jgi:hypothetical protein
MFIRNWFLSSSTRFRPCSIKASNRAENLFMRSRRSSKPQLMLGSVSATEGAAPSASDWRCRLDESDDCLCALDEREECRGALDGSEDSKEEAIVSCELRFSTCGWPVVVVFAFANAARVREGVGGSEGE